MSNATSNLHDEGKQLVMVHDGYQEHINNTLYSSLKGALPLSNNAMFSSSNPELVAEIAEAYKGHVTVAPYRTTEKPQGRVMFTMPEMPWKKYEIPAAPINTSLSQPVEIGATWFPIASFTNVIVGDELWIGDEKLRVTEMDWFNLRVKAERVDDGSGIHNSYPEGTPVRDYLVRGT